MKKFKTFIAAINEATAANFEKDMKYFKSMVDKDTNTKGMFDKYKIEPWGFSYSFDGYMDGGFYYMNGKVYDLQDVNLKTIATNPTAIKKFDAYNNIKDATAGTIKNLDPKQYDR